MAIELVGKGYMVTEIAVHGDMALDGGGQGGAPVGVVKDWVGRVDPMACLDKVQLHGHHQSVGETVDGRDLAGIDDGMAGAGAG